MSTKKLFMTACIFIAALLLNTNTALAAEEGLYPAQMTVNVYRAPTAAIGLNKTYLMYEIYVTSFMKMPTALTSLEVSDGTKTLYTYDAKKNPLVLQPNESKAIYISIPFDHLSDLPTHVSNQFIFSGKEENTVTNFPLITPALTVDKTPPAIVGAPLRGKDWLAGNGLSNTSLHRTSALYFNGRPFFPELYAIDFVQMGANGRTFAGDVHKNSSYYCYNQDILAVADGKVVKIQDGIPENIPHSDKLAVKMGTKTLPGNNIILDLGNNTFAAYGHLIPGSLKVKVGDHVTRGEVIAKLGNSGNSGEPHLHFQIVNKAAFLESDGIPYGFDHFTVIPSKMDNAENDTIYKLKFLKGQPKEYSNQLPLENTLIGFE